MEIIIGYFILIVIRIRIKSVCKIAYKGEGMKQKEEQS